MPSKTSAILKREAASNGPTAMQKPRPAPLALRPTKLPVPSQPSPTAASFQKYLHSRSTVTTGTKIPQSPRPRSMPAKPTSKNVVSRGDTYKKEPHGLLTPTSAAPASPKLLSSPSCPTSPRAPKKDEVRKVATQLRSPISPAKSPYMHVHVGDACICGALVHQLSCGHKVLTKAPGKCKSNCNRPLPPRMEKYANQKDESHAFVCTSCVEGHLEKHHQAKKAIFLESSEKMNVPEGWVERQLAYWERVWKNDIEKERAELKKLGEDCTCIPGEPIPIELAVEPKFGKSTGLPLPPTKKPKKLRTPSKILKVG